MSKEVIIGKEYIFTVTLFSEKLSNADKEKVEWAWKKEGGQIQYFENQGHIDVNGNVSKKTTFNKDLAGEIIYIMPFLEEPDPAVSVIVQVLIPAMVKEVILISGTEKESETIGNKLMFFAQAVREVRENYSNYKHITVLYYPDDYTEDQINAFTEAILNYNSKASIIEIDTRQKMIDYINTMTIDASKNKRDLPNIDNEIVQVGTIKVFSHGMPSRLTFGLGWPLVPIEVNNEKQEFNKTHVSLLEKEAFASNAEFYSFSCRTGNSSTQRSDFVGPGYNVVYYPINPRTLFTTTKFFETRAEAQRFFDNKNSGMINKAVRIDPVLTPFEQTKPLESLAQEIANHLDIKVYAYVVRSNYTNTWSEGEDQTYRDQYEYYEDESANDFYNPKDWIRGIKIGKWDEVIWNPQGAYGSVAPGSSPKGLPKNLYLFTKDSMPVAQ